MPPPPRRARGVETWSCRSCRWRLRLCRRIQRLRPQWSTRSNRRFRITSSFCLKTSIKNQRKKSFREREFRKGTEERQREKIFRRGDSRNQRRRRRNFRNGSFGGRPLRKRMFRRIFFEGRMRRKIIFRK